MNTAKIARMIHTVVTIMAGVGLLISRNVWGDNMFEMTVLFVGVYLLSKGICIYLLGK